MDGVSSKEEVEYEDIDIDIEAPVGAATGPGEEGGG